MSTNTYLALSVLCACTSIAVILLPILKTTRKRLSIAAFFFVPLSTGLLSLASIPFGLTYYESRPDVIARGVTEAKAREALHQPRLTKMVGGCEIWAFYEDNRWHNMAKCPSGNGQWSATVSTKYACGKATCVDDVTSSSAQKTSSGPAK